MGQPNCKLPVLVLLGEIMLMSMGCEVECWRDISIGGEESSTGRMTSESWWLVFTSSAEDDNLSPTISLSCNIMISTCGFFFNVHVPMSILNLQHCAKSQLSALCVPFSQQTIISNPTTFFSLGLFVFVCLFAEKYRQPWIFLRKCNVAVFR